MKEIYITKKCANCGHECAVYSHEYVQELSKQDFETEGYIALAQFTFINIENCDNCGYCNNDISKLINSNILQSEKYQALQKYSQLEQNVDNYYHILLIGAYVLEASGELLNSARAYLAVRQELGDRAHEIAKDCLSKAEQEKYQPIFDYFQKIKDYCLNKAIELCKMDYSLNANKDAFIMLYYLIKESEQKDKYNQMEHALRNFDLTDKQKLIVNTISSLCY